MSISFILCRACAFMYQDNMTGCPRCGFANSPQSVTPPSIPPQAGGGVATSWKPSAVPHGSPRGVSEDFLNPSVPGNLEFAAGVVRGSRAFRVGDDGRLTGVTYRYPWEPGENRARCLRSWTQGRLYDDYEEPDHSLSECSHGFYAYYEGSNDWFSPGMVMGIIEGYGHVEIGTRGFRAMKARIVGLHIPRHIYNTFTEKEITKKYPDVPQYRTFESLLKHHAPDDNGLYWPRGW